MNKEISSKKVILFYNEEKKPFLQVMVFENDEVKSEILEIDEGQIENGIPSNIELISDSLKNLIPQGVKEMSCLVNSEYVIKATNAYPTISFFKIMSLYDNDIKKSFPKYKDKYFTFIQKSKTKLENIFYTYFIPNNVKTFFLKLGKAMGISVKGISLFSMYLLNHTKKQIEGNYIYSYCANNIIHSIISYNGLLTGFFTSNNVAEELEKDIFCFGTKHFYELEKEKIEVVSTNSSEIKANSLEFNVKEFSFEFGLFKGIKQ